MWLPWSRSSLDGLGVFLEYSIPNAIMESFFLFSLELIVCLSGYGIILSHENNVKKTDFSAITVSMNMISVVSIISVGMSYTISSIIGNFQSTNKSSISKKYTKLAVLLGMSMITMSIVIFYNHSNKILKQYLNSDESVNRIMENLPIYFTLIYLVSYYGICNGIIKGLGL